jgi:hypothetical protein
MPTYEIEQYELHVQRYRIAATDEAEAITKLFDGEAVPVDNGLDFIEVADDYGLSADNYRDLAAALREQGVPVDVVIPSIRSIEVAV